MFRPARLPTAVRTKTKLAGEDAALCRHTLKRERIEHDLAEEEKHCAACSQDLRHIGEETQRALRIHSGAVAGDRGRLQEVRVRMHGEDGGQAAAADREERGGRVVCWRR